MKTKCLIVDDEPIAIDIINKYLENFNDFEVVGTCENAIQAFNVLKNKNVDLIFLDINMPGINGIDFIKTLNNPPKIIITTAYREFAIEGYEINVVDYLLKPISFERFLKAISHYQETENSQVVLNRSDNIKEEEAFLYVRENRKVHKIYLSNIIYIEGFAEYIKIHTKTNTLVPKLSLNSIIQQLPEKSFVRIHNSYIISLRYVTSFSQTQIEIGDLELPISRSYRNGVLNALNFSF